MNEQKIINNLLLFLDRVEVKGRQEVAGYAECVNWLEGEKAKLTPAAEPVMEKKSLPDKK